MYFSFLCWNCIVVVSQILYNVDEGDTLGWRIGYKEVKSLNDLGEQAVSSLQTAYQLTVFQNREQNFLSYISHYYSGLF
jgi:hypothetical protein